MQITSNRKIELCDFPLWVPQAAKHYINHIERGRSIRQVARSAGCHASTILRQIRKLESRRDDPLIDEALCNLGRVPELIKSQNRGYAQMNVTIRENLARPDQAMIEREGRRILRRLCEPGACLAIAKDMEKAVVVRETSSDDTTRTAVVDREVAQAMALKDWISCDAPGRISRYRITGTGRAALKELLAQVPAAAPGFAEAPASFAMETSSVTPSKRVRYGAAESPVLSLTRRKNKDGSAFLSPAFVTAAERLREDFELAQMAPNPAQNWDQFLAPAAENGAETSGAADAQTRVGDALRDLGPGLGDVALRVVCMLEGLETAEKRMGWSARSGKVVLRIALQRLDRHYEETGQGHMIG